MILLNVIKKDSKHAPVTIFYKLCHGHVTLADQEEALKNPQCALLFARKVPGADIRKCEEIACQDPEYAYYFALYIPGADIRKCQEAFRILTRCLCI